MDSHFSEGADKVFSTPSYLEGRTWRSEALELESRLLLKLFSEFPSCFMLFS